MGALCQEPGPSPNTYLLCHIRLYLLDTVPVKVICDQWVEFTLKNDLDLHGGMSLHTQGWPSESWLGQRVESLTSQGKQTYVDYGDGGLGPGAGMVCIEKEYRSIPIPPLPFPETRELGIYPFCWGQSGPTHGTTDNSGNSYIAPGEQPRIMPMAFGTMGATEVGVL